MPRRIILLIGAALLALIVSASALNLKMIEVNVTGPSPPAANKLKIDIIPEDVIVGEEAKIIIRDHEGNPVKKAKVYVAENHDPSTKVTYIGETNSSGELTYVFEKEGWHRVHVEKEGFQPQEALINVRLKGALSFSMELKEAHGDKQLKTLHITSNGQPIKNAEVYVNDTFIGYTDNNGELNYTFKLGKVYKITVKKKGYRGLIIILDMNPKGGTGTIIQPLKDT